MSLLLFVPALLAMVGAAKIYWSNAASRALALAICSAVGYWYILPGTIFLSELRSASPDAYLALDETSSFQAVLLVHSSLVLLLLLPRALTQSRPWEVRSDSTAASRLDVLLALCVCSSLAIFFIRFREYGSELFLDLLTGLSSAREFMTFENTSTSTAASMLALWEIVTSYVAIFLATIFILRKQAASSRTAFSIVALLFLFMASGTRAFLLLLLFASAFAMTCRAAPKKAQAKGIVPVLKAVIPILIIGVVVLAAGQGMLARFTGDSESGSLILDALTAHNDMFRELIFSIQRGDNYRADGLLLLLTPLSFAMPSFLGFEKEIPPHLVDFNFDRAGIDVVYGAGNVFPGLIADMYLCFGLLAPVALALLSAAMLYVCWWATLHRRNTDVAAALFMSLLAYFTVGFRNLPGSFVILVVLSLTLVIYLQPRRAKAQRGETNVHYG